MKPILSEEARPVLDEIARERMLLAFDFDGTLAPLVDDRAAARMRDCTRKLLRLVSLMYPCTVISGRSRADLVPRLDTVPLVAMVGNHGAEAGHGPIDRSVRRAVEEWKAKAQSLLHDYEGIELEDKGLSLAIHYRRAPVREVAHRVVRTAASMLEGARVFDGHAVVNVVPPAAHSKGEALLNVASRVGQRGAFFVGDDTTDEDAFRNEVVRISVRVGRSDDSAARYFIPSQDEIDDLLRALLGARLRADGLEGEANTLERILDP